MHQGFSVLDTHTGGEITRIVLGQEIGLADAPVDEQRRQLSDELDWVRKSLTSEPRGSAYAVGAVVTAPRQEPTPADEVSTGDPEPPRGKILFFNNVGYLGMCGHGLIGVIEALRHLDLIRAGAYEFETPAGTVTANLLPDHRVRFTGVDSRVTQTDVSLQLPGGDQVTGDIAYGGNWFFLAQDERVASADIAELMTLTGQIKHALDAQGLCGDRGEAIDHIELCGALEESQSAGCRSFVLCPGGHFDRSPCGTGTSAKLACLAHRNKLAPNEPWVQESITGSRFSASYVATENGVLATITGRAHVMAETRQIYDLDDSLRFGFPVDDQAFQRSGRRRTEARR